ncbi:MAG: pyrroline-5-carboxylate reductase [Actinobacteria bacterium]|nr:pyrroline-5-carboxylate reductase [Actinomycetota bacterium]
MRQLQVIGGGKMGEALLGGLLESGWTDAAGLRVVEPVAARRAELLDRFPGVEVTTDLAAGADHLIAVKPGEVAGVCRALAELGGVRRVLSVAAGVPTARLEEALGTGVAVVRAMPNTPALIGMGAAAIAAGTAATAEDLDWAESVLTAVGVVARVEESQIDAVTGLSGSGPAYVFLVAEAMIEAGVLVGLSRPVAERLAVQTLVGSAALLQSGDRSAADRRADVTSPGGTTAAGLQVLERAAVRAAFLDAVAAATARSAELGR